MLFKLLLTFESGSIWTLDRVLDFKIEDKWFAIYYLNSSGYKISQRIYIDGIRSIAIEIVPIIQSISDVFADKYIHTPS